MRFYLLETGVHVNLRFVVAVKVLQTSDGWFAAVILPDGDYMRASDFYYEMADAKRRANLLAHSLEEYGQLPLEGGAL